MITIEEIKRVLFGDNDALEAHFISMLNDLYPPVNGERLDEKLANFLNQENDSSIQRILPIFIRHRLHQFRSAAQTEYSQRFKTEHINLIGGELFENMRLADGVTDYTQRYEIVTDEADISSRKEIFDEQVLHARNIARNNHESYESFLRIKNWFIQERGRAIWSANRKADESEDKLRHTELSTVFFERFARTYQCDNLAVIIQYVFDAEMPLQAYHDFKYRFCYRWSEEIWETCKRNASQASVPGSDAAPADTLESGIEQRIEASEAHQQPPNEISEAMREFIDAKDELSRIHPNVWHKQSTARYNISYRALELAYRYRTEYIMYFGQHEWSSVMYPPEIIEKLESVKNGFEKKWKDNEQWHEDLWNQCCENQINIAPDIKEDFEERKSAFITQCASQFGIEDPWTTSMTHPKPLAKTTQLIKKLKSNFVCYWGEQDFKRYIDYHASNGAWATEQEIRAIGKLFGFRIQITDINAYRANSYWLDNQDSEDESSQPAIHFYCQNNTHYYIHEGGYGDTEANGNCFYNGLAQWLQLLYKGQKPRSLAVLPASDVGTQRSILAVQHALVSEISDTSSSRHSYDQASSVAMSIDSAIQSAHHQESNDATSIDILPHLDLSPLFQLIQTDELQIRTIRKELHLNMENLSPEVFGQFLQTKARELLRIIREKKLPLANRIPLLERIERLAQTISSNPEYCQYLTKLQTILLYVANTAYLPHSKDNTSSDWTTQAYRDNIVRLQQTIATDSDQFPENPFGELCRAIIGTNFNDNAQERIPMIPQLMSLRLFNPAPAPAPAPTHTHYYNQPIPNMEPADDNYLSAALCVAGIFILITSITFLLSLLIFALTSGLAGLGLMLMQTSLASLATTLGGVIGLSAPHTAIALTTGLSCAAATLGYTLFKDFAPRNIPSWDTLIMPAHQMY